jgi:hypothetical protein
MFWAIAIGITTGARLFALSVWIGYTILDKKDKDMLISQIKWR